MATVTLQGYIKVPECALSEVNTALNTHIQLTRDEAGCLAFEVTQSDTDKHVFNVYEEFVDKNAFDYHQERVKNSYWGQVTKGVARYYQITES